MSWKPFHSYATAVLLTVASLFYFGFNVAVGLAGFASFLLAVVTAHHQLLGPPGNAVPRVEPAGNRDDEAGRHGGPPEKVKASGTDDTPPPPREDPPEHRELLGRAAVGVAFALTLVAFMSWVTGRAPGWVEPRPERDPAIPTAVATPSASVSPLLTQPELVSGTEDAVPGDAASGRPSLSESGRYVAFTSAAGNIGSNDRNRLHDVFWMDRTTGERRLVSRGLTGGAANEASQFPSICPSGDAVAFASKATDLVDVPLSPGRWRIYVWYRTAHRLRLVTPATGDADGDSGAPALTADCKRIVFMSKATNWTRTARLGGGPGVFLYDLSANTARTVSADVVGTVDELRGQPTIDAAGQRVAYAAFVGRPQRSEVFLWDATDGETTRVSQLAVSDLRFGAGSSPMLSRDGNHLALLVGTSVDDLSEMVVWSVGDRRVARATNGRIARWSDACQESTDNGIRHAPGIATGGQGPVLMYHAYHEGECRLVVRRLLDAGTITTIHIGGGDVTEPTISADASTVAWAETAPGDRSPYGLTLQVYVCAHPQQTSTRPRCHR